MCRPIFFTILLLFVCHLLYAQLQATENEALVTFRLYRSENNQGHSNLAIRITGKKIAAGMDLMTDAKGELTLLLPTNCIYALHLKELPNFGSIEIGDGKFQKHYIPIPYDGKKMGQNAALSDKNNFLLRLQVNDKSGKALTQPEKITLRDKASGKNYQLSSDKNGRAAVSLPRGSTYIVSFDAAPDYYSFTVPKENDIWEERLIFERKAGFTLFPTMGKGLINFRYIDLNNKPIAQERFDVTDKNSGETFTCSTNRYGIGQVLLPLNRVYLFSTPFNPHFDEMEVKLKEGFHLFEFEVLYQSPSSADLKKRMEQMEAISALRDSIAMIITTEKTALDEAQKEEKEFDLDAAIPLKNKKTFYIRKELVQKADAYRDSLLINPKVFEQHNNPVMATLNRLQTKSKNRVIVTDVTKSMDRYMEEVLVWHALNLSKGLHNRYIFFNDGDDKICAEKIIGKTGGIYACEGKLEDLDSIIAKMQEATAARMGGGEPPENDIEALLAALRFEGVDEIVLVADAHSRVRDMELLRRLKIPVRVILCGAEEQNKFYINKKEINEQYLTLALRTGGSVHTLSSDILDLSKTADGDVIELQGIRYLLKNRQFVRL